MLRVAVPYGMLSAAQMRCMAEVCDRYDRGYCHITTRQNVQFNWVKMEDVADILDTLASVEMHAIQTSGNCIRNTTSDPLAGVAADEQTDPRPYCEIIRQWSSLHPEFAFLPRKFKIAVIGAAEDRASIQLHDVGLQLVTNADGETGFKVWVGGGLGRTPMLATLIRAFLPQAHLLGYLKAVLRVYNRYGRRDNKYKARIKILVNSLGAADFSAQVEAEFQRTNSEEYWLTDAELAHARSFFTEPAYEQLNVTAEAEAPDSPAYRHWLRRNVREHRVAGYAIVTLSLKHQGTAPGDITSEQLRRVADLAEQFSFGEARNTQQQNIVLADVKRSDLFALWQEACRLELAAPTIGTLSDVVCCPGGFLWSGQCPFSAD